MGSFVASSMITSLLVTLLVGGLILFLVLRVAKASRGVGGANVGAMADPVPGTLLVTAASFPSRNALYQMSTTQEAAQNQAEALAAVMRARQENPPS